MNQSRPSLLPNLFIVGAPKSGTSSVHQWIAAHPDACGTHDKETYFFVDPGTHMFRPHAHISAGLDTWRAQFDEKACQRVAIIVESTPSHMYSATALEHIPALASEPKLLFILREPSVQIYSLYNYFQNNWNWIPARMTFAQFVDAVRQSSHDFGGNELARNALANAHYVRHLRQWRERVGPDRMLVLNFDDLRSDPQAFMVRISRWIGLDPDFYRDYTFPRENETYTPRSRALQALNRAVRSHLPAGPLYRMARSAYRRLNTRKPAAHPPQPDRAVLDELQREFAKSNIMLHNEFKISFAGGQ